MFNENKLNLNLNSKEVNLIVGGKTHNNMRTNILLIFFLMKNISYCQLLQCIRKPFHRCSNINKYATMFQQRNFIQFPNQ